MKKGSRLTCDLIFFGLFLLIGILFYVISNPAVLKILAFPGLLLFIFILIKQR